MEKETKDWGPVTKAFQTWQKETTEDTTGILLFCNEEEYYFGLQGSLIEMGLLFVACAEHDDNFRRLIKIAAEVLESKHSAECTSPENGEE